MCIAGSSMITCKKSGKMGENNNIFDPSLLIDVITSVRLFAGVFYGGL
jgi:hypothetical protein